MQSHTVHIVPSTRKTAEYQCMTIWIWWVLFTAYTHKYHAEWYTRRYFRMLFRWFFYCCCRLDAIPLRKGDDLNSIFFPHSFVPTSFFLLFALCHLSTHFKYWWLFCASVSSLWMQMKRAFVLPIFADFHFSSDTRTHARTLYSIPFVKSLYYWRHIFSLAAIFGHKVEQHKVVARQENGTRRQIIYMFGMDS